jgi:two-component system, cell cycle sensor histidine kinase and response regulator CckA
MEDEDPSREELLAETAALRKRVADLESEGSRSTRWMKLAQEANALREKLLSQESFERKLKRITDFLVESFSADFSRIWITKPGDRCHSHCVHAKITEGPHVCRYRDRCLHLMASSGRYTHTDSPLHRRVPYDCYKIGRIASGAEPKFLTNHAFIDPAVHNQAWAKELGLIAFAGYRLLSHDEKPIGVMALFAKQAISTDEDVILQNIANTTSQVIQTATALDRLIESKELYRLLIETTDTGYVVLDEQGLVLDANLQYARLMGYDSVDEILRRSVIEWTAEHDKLRNAHYVSLCKSKGFVRNLEVDYVDREGNYIPIEINATAVKNQENIRIITLCRDITRRKRAEEALRESEEKFRSIVEGAPEAVFVQTGGLFAYLNDQALRLFGAKHNQDLRGKPVLDRFHPWFHEVIRERIHHLNVEKKHVPTMEEVYIRLDGSEINVEVSAVPIRFENQDGALIFAHDITERNKMVEALCESEEKFRIAFQTSPDAISITRVGDGLYIDINDAFSELTGFSRHELIGNSSLDLGIWNDPEDRMLLLSGIQQFGYVRNLEAQFQLKDGSLRAGLMSARIIALNGEPHILSVTRDVEEWKRAQDALLESERNYKDLFEYSTDLNYMHDLKGNVISVNEAVTRVLGYTAEEFLDLNVTSIIDPAHLPLTEQRFREQLEKVLDRSGPYEILARAKDGHPVWLEFTNRLIKHREKITGVHGTARDITFRKEAEAERSRLVAAIEQAGDIIVITDSAANILYVNPAFESTTGFKREEIMGKNPNILGSGNQDKAFYAEMWQTLTTGEVWRGHFTNKKKNGTLYEETATISPIKDASGRIINYVAVKRDVTAELALEKQLLHSQKMEAIGTLAGGVAHDLNNLLQAVLGYSDLLLMKKDPSHPDRRKLEVIHQAALDGADLISRILTFSRKGELKSRPVELNDQIRRSENLLRRMLPRMIEIELLLADDIGTIEIDPAQLEQVILNLAINAQHAMPDGGRLILEASNVSLKDEYTRSHLGAKEGNYVLFSVTDTGVGIDPGIMERIFEPFFTTKPSGLGTGLGLSTVHGIVKQHGGYITCYSELGRGTSFKIYFPVSSSKVTFDSSLTREMPAFGTETILLVDDDDRIREMGSQMIGMGGYQVLIAKNGEEALEIYSRRKDEIAIIILDLIMPGMGGCRCLEELLRADPQVKILISSGYSPHLQSQGQEIVGARGFIHKPYEAKEILKSIRTVIDEGTFLNRINQIKAND